MSKPEKPVRIPDIQSKKARGEKITMLTAYSSWQARLLWETGSIDLFLVGDSLGMVELGYDTTVPVTMEDMLHHARSVRRGAPQALIVADMPFLSHRTGLTRALRNAGRLVQEGAATAVKVEGGEAIAPTVAKIVAAGIPVMGHLGLTPQAIHVLGGLRRQAKLPEEQEHLLADARALQSAGAFALVLEYVPDSLGYETSKVLDIPVIGIGSGPGCDGQVLVTHDILGLSGGRVPAFAKAYAKLDAEIKNAVTSFAGEVRSGRFPPASGN